MYPCVCKDRYINVPTTSNVVELWFILCKLAYRSIGAQNQSEWILYESLLLIFCSRLIKSTIDCSKGSICLFVFQVYSMRPPWSVRPLGTSSAVSSSRSTATSAPSTLARQLMALCIFVRVLICCILAKILWTGLCVICIKRHAKCAPYQNWASSAKLFLFWNRMLSLINDVELPSLYLNAQRKY